MELIEAKKLGARICVKTFLFGVLGVEALFFFSLLRGDLANGLLFHLTAHAHPIPISFLAAVLLAAFLFGKMAGPAILVHGKKYWVLGLLYGLVTFAVIAVLYWGIPVWMASQEYQHTTPPAILYFEYSVMPLLLFGISILLLWMVAVWQIHIRKTVAGKSTKKAPVPTEANL